MTDHTADRFLQLVAENASLRDVIRALQSRHAELLTLLALSYGGEDCQLRVTQLDWITLARLGRVELQTSKDPATGDLLYKAVPITLPFEAAERNGHA